jgi:hypothetical protein
LRVLVRQDALAVVTVLCEHGPVHDLMGLIPASLPGGPGQRRWLVMKRPVSVSPAQAAALSLAPGFANKRPTQPVNARPLLR